MSHMVAFGLWTMGIISFNWRLCANCFFLGVGPESDGKDPNGLSSLGLGGKDAPVCVYP